MIVSSYQGTRLSAADRRRLDQQRLYQRPQSNHLREQTDETLRELERRKEQGAKRVNVWSLDYEITFTKPFADVFGF